MSGTSKLEFSTFIDDRTKDFTGREWVFRVVETWLASPDGPRRFLLTGGPGSGKTAVAARLAQMSLGQVDATPYAHLGIKPPGYGAWQTAGL